MDHPPLPPNYLLPIRSDCIDGWTNEINRLKAQDIGNLPFTERGRQAMEYHMEYLAYAHNCLWDWVDYPENPT